MTISMGTGSGGVVLTSAITNGNVTIDASTFAGTIDTMSMTASGSIVVSVGSNGDFSAGTLASIGALTVDAAAATSGSITLTSVTAGGNATISMGAGTGSLTLTSVTAAGNFTLDASTFGGAVELNSVSASGVATVSLGSAGDFSAGQVESGGAFTLDAANATTGAISIGGLQGRWKHRHFNGFGDGFDNVNFW